MKPTSDLCPDRNRNPHAAGKLIELELAMSPEIDYSRRGLVKLMLKMPALRGELQMLSARNADFFSLCGAFEEATSTLDRLRKERSFSNINSILEYENLCAEIENEIIEMCGNI